MAAILSLFATGSCNNSFRLAASPRASLLFISRKVSRSPPKPFARAASI